MASVTIKKLKGVKGGYYQRFAGIKGSYNQNTPAGGGEAQHDVDDYIFTIYTKGKDDDHDFKMIRGPKEIEYTGMTGAYNEGARPDRQPLLRRKGHTLRKMSMTLFLWYPDIERSIDFRLENLEWLAKTDIPLLVEYDPRTHGEWRITSMTYKSMERNAATNQITRAEVSLELTEDPEPTKVSLNQAVKKRPKTYKAKKGENLFDIVLKFYQTDSTKIVNAVAKVNDIKHPRRIQAGKKIKLP